ncbi:MAG: NAD(P)-binding domain-containing protein [Bacteroidota bacterium]|nr:NAD(P)-binding domain-containing protein [Bacteroidota bacterium]
MNIGILGTGVVGQAIATALTEKGHNVRLGSRTTNSEKGAEWVKNSNEHATQGDFADAASFGDIIFICLNGEHALDVVNSLIADDLQGKIIVDVTNPLDFSKGMPPSILKEFTTTSMAEAIQQTLPAAHVVKALNTVNYKLMVNAKEVAGGDHNLFICGDNADAKTKVKQLLVNDFNWNDENILDLGGIEKARVTEAIVPFWVSVMQALGSPLFNFKIVH